MLTFIHGADFHLDSPFSGLDPQQAIQRRKEQRELLEKLVQVAQEKQVQFVLLSGDLLDGQTTYRETAMALAEELGKLTCPVFISPGNHDYYHRTSLYAGSFWPENVHIFRSSKIEQVALGAQNCVIYGRAFQAQQETQSPLQGFSVAQDGRMHIMALHAQVDGKGNYAPITREQIAESGLDYLALGHVHLYDGLQQEGKTHWAYAGCPEGRGFDETGKKGVLLVTLDEQDGCQVEQIPLAKRRYHVQTIDISHADDPAAAIWMALDGEPKQDIYRIYLTGTREGGLNLNHLHHELAPLVYSAVLYDQTKTEQMVWSRIEEDTLTGRFLRQMAILIQASPEDETLQQAVRFGLAALEHGEDVAP